MRPVATRMRLALEGMRLTMPAAASYTSDYNLHSPPPHHRPRTPPHDPKKLVALNTRQIPNPHPLSHTTSLRDPDHEVVDATPQTFPGLCCVESDPAAWDRVRVGSV